MTNTANNTTSNKRLNNEELASLTGLINRGLVEEWGRNAIVRLVDGDVALNIHLSEPITVNVWRFAIELYKDDRQTVAKAIKLVGKYNLGVSLKVTDTNHQ